MKKFLTFVLIITLGYFLTILGPWYLIALAGFLGGLALKNQWIGFLIGFLAGFFLWVVQVWLMTNASNSDLPERLAQLFGLPNTSLLVISSALVGGLVTGFGAVTGVNLIKTLKK
ncbi:hypothetical protein [Winogradskyella aurantia]|uniref:DUF4199 domain-containing protein n=1 Tax=Winogradskyella aurantia TaxID=1915063 RepID=A0A265UXR1_9FLAO|nr:hypothetical protein [Winogradskyella aurantia]OZV70094.1 hypothetical protein CA834_05605 [Winogradskyella aurantia]